MQQHNTSMVLFNNPLIRFIADDRYRWLRHTLFILFCLILGFKGDVGVSNDHRSPEVIRAFLIMDTWTTGSIMAMMYLLLLVLIPRLLFRSKVFLFAICFFILISLIYFIAWGVDYIYLRPFDGDIATNFQHVDLSFMAYIQLCGIATILLGSVVGIAIFKKWINDVQRMNELQQTNLKAELEQLKSQVNPHFLFNTLNNLLVLTKTDPQKASVVLLGLSDLLRYQLYDSAKEKIVLSKDIAFIRNFLSLEKIRKNDFTFSIHTEGNMDSQMLPPFLFIPFVENAVKHGASTVGHSYLNLNFIIKDKQLHFHSENSKPPVKQQMIGGLGLGNIKRRLELLYPGTHTLEITDRADTYTVNLILPL
ncbi:MAG TPA: histidine kinase [Ferruginibacter sp.]|nr:histidine kinase [Ferruginibacter sp.]